MREPRSRSALLTAALLICAGVLARPRPAAAQGAPSLREAIEAFEARLDRAVGQVSRPAPGILLGRAESARGYHLAGYGAVFVLTPRAVPRKGQVYVFRRRVAPGAARLRIETRVERSAPDAEEAGRAALADLPPAQAAERPSAQGQRSPGTGQEARPGSGSASTGDPEADELIAIEQQVLEFQREAEEARQSAEREFERLTRDIRGRLAAVPDPAAAASPTAPPTVVPLPPPGELPLPPPPPWRFWFEEGGPPDERSPDEVVADVRTAVIATLESEAERLTLPGSEYVAVAIDFVPAGPFVSQARPARTMVIRARKQDLDARVAGKLSGDDLRRRIEVSEY